MEALPDMLIRVSESPTTLALCERQSSERELMLDAFIKGEELESTALQPTRLAQTGTLIRIFLPNEANFSFELRLIKSPPVFGSGNNVNSTLVLAVCLEN